LTQKEYLRTWGFLVSFVTLDPQVGMGKTLDLGRRIELYSMDKQCHDISLGLYRRDLSGELQFLVYTYSRVAEVSERVAFIRQALVTMLGLESAEEGGQGWLRFPCRCEHKRAIKRAFLDLCRLETGADLEVKPLTAFDKKAGGDLTAKSLGNGRYRIQAAGDTPAMAKRIVALARGFAKLCEMESLEGDEATVCFPCSQSHDEIISMMMFRAQNVRAAMKEEEMAAGRGMLAAPSQ
jgi:hypothetical protein